MGNNREVARLYSERLGYTVNESTVRGIKKRYLEVTPMFHLSVSEVTMVLFFPQFFSYIPVFIFPPFYISPARVCTRAKSAPLESPREPQEGRRTAGREGRRRRKKKRQVFYSVSPSFHISSF